MPEGASPSPVRTTGPGRALGPAIVAVAIALAVAVLKPWGAGPPGGAVRGLVASPGAATASRSAGPAGSSAPSQIDVAAELVAVPGTSSLDCFSTSGWLLVADGSLAGRRVRSWTAIVPASASSPADTTIPVVDVVADDVSALGFCAPVSVTPRSVSWQATLWSVPAAGSPGPPEPVAAARIAAPAGHLGTLALGGAAPGARLASPPAGRAGPSAAPGVVRVWPPGRYVMELRPVPPAEPALWMGVDVQSVSR